MLLKAYPNILGDKKDEPVLTKPDGNSFFTIEPRVHKVENIYFMESLAKDLNTELGSGTLGSNASTPFQTRRIAPNQVRLQVSQGRSRKHAAKTTTATFSGGQAMGKPRITPDSEMAQR